MRKRIAIVILNWNGKKMMEQFLPSVVSSLTDESELIVADNASTDDSIEFLSAHYPTLRVIQLDKNYGFAEGYNRAIEQLDHDYIILLNSDIETPVGWIGPLFNYMEQHTDCAACQPKLHSWYEKDKFEYAGAAGGYIDRYGYPFCRGRIFTVTEQDISQYDNDEPLLWATGACLMIRRKLYQKSGGLDARFFAHNEEIDLCWRLRLMGYTVHCVASSIVYHIGGGTLPQGNPRKTFLNFRNNLAMLYKNLPDNELRQTMRLRCILDYIAAVKSLLIDRNMADFKAIVRARKAFKQWIPELKKERERIKLLTTNTHIPERKSYSILFYYYIKGVKFYKDLPHVGS